MATNTAGNTARHSVQQDVRFARFTVAYNDSGIASGVAKVIIPSGSVILRANVVVTAAFNAATTNVLTVGKNASDYNDIVDASDVNEGATGAYVATRGMALSLSSDTTIYAKYTQSGTAADAGAATVIIEYVENV